MRTTINKELLNKAQEGADEIRRINFNSLEKSTQSLANAIGELQKDNLQKVNAIRQTIPTSIGNIIKNCLSFPLETM